MNDVVVTAKLAMPRETPTQAKTSAQIIWDAIMDLHNQQQPITRASLMEVTGLKMSIIDDHVARMVDDGRLRRVIAGVFSPVVLHNPPRPMSKTILDGGAVLIEIGDQVLHLTPQEDRSLAALQAGAAIQLTNIHASREVNELTSDVREVMKNIRNILTLPQGGAPLPRRRKGRAAPEGTVVVSLAIQHGGNDDVSPLVVDALLAAAQLVEGGECKAGSFELRAVRARMTVTHSGQIPALISDAESVNG